MKVKAYEGKEKFIFVSYAHKDSVQVLSVIQKLQEQGYRVWFDEGIAPGSEWPEDIANHLKDSAMVLAFISERAVQSVNCRNEINMACSRNKPFLGIMLEEVELTSGLELQLASKQCIFRHNHLTEEEFLAKVFRCPDLEPCKGEVPVKQETQRLEEQISKEQTVKMQSAEVQNTKVQSVVEQAVIHTPEAQAIPEKTVGAFQERNKQSKTIYVAVTAVVAVIGMVIGLVCFNRVKITDDVKVTRGETYLTLTGQTITAEQIAQINKLEKLRYLEFDGCIFEENAFAEWEPHEEITSFSVKNTDTLKDYSFLQKQTGIQFLYLISCGLNDENFSATEMNQLIRVVLENNPDFTDLSLINRESLTGLHISGTGVVDLSPMTNSRLKEVDFSGTKVSDVTALGAISTLVTVNGSNTEVADITSLAVLQDVKELYFNNCKIQNITEPMMALKMQRIGFANNGLQDCSGFGYFTVLVEVDLGGNQLRNVDFLKKNVESLKVLDLSVNDLSATELEFLAQCTGMEELCLNDLPLVNLDFASGMAELNTIHANYCGLVDVSGLSGSSKLEEVRLAHNEIADLTGLQNLTFEYGTILDLGYNRLTDITALAKGHYKWLILLGNDVKYVDGALVEITGNNLVFTYSEDIMKGELANDIFYNYYLVDCPADRQLEIQNVLGQSSTHFMREADALEFLCESGFDYGQLQN